MLIAIGFAAIAVNVACDEPGGDLLVPEKKTECTPAFSSQMGGRALWKLMWRVATVLNRAQFSPFIVYMGYSSGKTNHTSAVWRCTE